ncbi:hypothetical protein [Nostoc sp. MS1]|uniref:hypothetical protein n=1 Tax=Nostoc sp. MS1 TaxID=2764711 RepID=UPI001CC7ED93|nr:hypothetical protein [Nostoc sp. MS1]BCL39811.1 hypothetical protein NSMS1_62580 [Nostoc sp. MS1]BCL39937.1 hypothetical protein NSMS1_63840 [Nostoc sp. MS1]
MQPTISIPKDWDYPRFVFGQRTQQGVILSLEYYPVNTQLAYEYGHGWRYGLMRDKHCQEISHYQESQLKTLSTQELLTQITTELEQHQTQIMILQQQLAAITGGSNG